MIAMGFLPVSSPLARVLIACAIGAVACGIAVGSGVVPRSTVVLVLGLVRRHLPARG